MSSDTASQQSAAPAVSVIIPAWRVAPYIAETVDSVLAQSFRNFEVIVVNDASPDTPALEAVLEPYGSRIRYLVQPENRGPSAARNRAIREARGVFVAFLDGDDVWLRDCLSAHMQVLRERPELDLLYGDMEYFGSSREAGRRFQSMFPSSGPVTTEALLALTCSVPTSATLARRAAVIEAGLFDERFRYSEDFDLWVRMSLRGFRLGYHDRVVARHRVHDTSLTADTAAHRKTLLEVLAKLRSEAGMTGDQIRIIDRFSRQIAHLLYYEAAKSALLGGQYEAAARYLSQAARAENHAKIRALRWCVTRLPRVTHALAAAWMRAHPGRARSASA